MYALTLWRWRVDWYSIFYERTKPWTVETNSRDTSFWHSRILLMILYFRKDPLSRALLSLYSSIESLTLISVFWLFRNETGVMFFAPSLRKCITHLYSIFQFHGPFILKKVMKNEFELHGLITWIKCLLLERYLLIIMEVGWIVVSVCAPKTPLVN
jgi:hypothetical protein